MRKPAFCICENKDADQLRGYREADQHLCFCYTDSIIPLLSKSEFFKPLAIFCGCTARFVSYQVRNPEDRFSHNEAHLFLKTVTFTVCVLFLFEPCSEKTGLRGFRPGPTQIGLYSHRRWLEA